MRTRSAAVVLAAAASIVIGLQVRTTTILSENFDEPGGFFGGGYHNIPADPPGDWHVINNSSPAGQNTWFDGPQSFHASLGAQSGTHYAGVDAASGGSPSAQTLSNWLLTPQISFSAGDQVSFYTRTVSSPNYPDRLQLWLSTAGASTDVGTTETSTGVFTSLLVDVNPTYKVSGGGSYPTNWTQFTIAMPVGGSGRLGFRYFVENGGPGGANSDYIGVDTISVIGADVVSQWAASAGGSWGTPGNWSGSGVPNAAAAKVKFLSTPTGLTSAGTITLDGSRTIGELTFNNTNSHMIAAGTGGTLTIDDAGNAAPSITVNGGSHTIAAPIALANGVTITTDAGTALTIGGDISGSGTITAAGAGSLTLAGALPAVATIHVSGGVSLAGNTGSAPLNRTIAALNVDAGKTAVLGASAFPAHPMVLTVTTLGLPDVTSKLNVTNNEVLVADDPSVVRGEIAAGQIFTTSTGGAVGSIDAGSGQTEIRFTLLGDTNLDGSVDVTDLGNLASSYGAGSGAVWVRGDTNYDGAVDVTDLGNLASNYGGALAGGSAAVPTAVIASSASSGATVPEPAMSLLCAIFSGYLCIRTRRAKTGFHRP